MSIYTAQKINDYSKSFYWMITNPQIKCWTQFCILKKKGDACYIAGFAIFYRRCQLFIIFTICSPHDSTVADGRGLEKLKCTLHGCSITNSHVLTSIVCNWLFHSNLSYNKGKRGFRKWNKKLLRELKVRGWYFQRLSEYTKKSMA